jgi:hypothetical protein
VTTPRPALAVIDGTLCEFQRDGSRSVGHAPIATAVVEFLRGPMCFFVREHAFGLLPGMPNLYCLDLDYGLQWLAEWPADEAPCSAILGLEDDVLSVSSGSGSVVRIDATTGRLIAVERSLAATG